VSAGIIPPFLQEIVVVTEEEDGIPPRLLWFLRQPLHQCLKRAVPVKNVNRLVNFGESGQRATDKIEATVLGACYIESGHSVGLGPGELKSEILVENAHAGEMHSHCLLVLILPTKDPLDPLEPNLGTFHLSSLNGSAA
jgi:hypothetical protein